MLQIINVVKLNICIDEMKFTFNENREAYSLMITKGY